jgi:hypothetical protein
MQRHGLHGEFAQVEIASPLLQAFCAAAAAVALARLRRAISAAAPSYDRVAVAAMRAAAIMAAELSDWRFVLSGAAPARGGRRWADAGDERLISRHRPRKRAIQ